MSVKVYFKDGAPSNELTIESGEKIGAYDNVLDVENNDGHIVGIFPMHAIVGAVVLAEEPEARSPRLFNSFADVPEGVVVLERSSKTLNRNQPMSVRRVDGKIEAAADPRVPGSWINLPYLHREFGFPLVEQVGFEYDSE